MNRSYMTRLIRAITRARNKRRATWGVLGRDAPNLLVKRHAFITRNVDTA